VIMIKKNTIIVTGLVMGTLALHSFASAHGTEQHDKMVPDEIQMKKLHAMMPIFSLASAGMETALNKDDIAVLEAEAKKIITAIPDLKKSKPHNNAKQRKKFVELAIALGKTIHTTVDLAKKGDLAGAKLAFKNVEGTCAACHAKFRD
jgi:soluble cytochrome b562